jgi:UDP-N-acetylglucosamine 4,6-dehydratase
MRVVDLAEAIAPGAKREVIGIRPGEKLHELLITSDEARHTVDAGDVYVITPEHPWWSQDWHAEGRPLPDGFVYSSETNDEWLDVGQLRAMLSDVT